MSSKMKKKSKKHYRLRKKHFFAITAEMIVLFIVFQLVGNFSFVEYRNPAESLKEKMSDQRLTELTAQMEKAPNYETEEQMEYLVISKDFSEDSMEVSSVLETLEGMKLAHYCVLTSEAENIEVSNLPDSLRGVIICGDKEGTALSEMQREELVEKGIHIIYTQMPGAEGIRENHLESLLGIYKMNGMLKQQGMRFTDEVFLGGILDLEEIEYPLEDVELEPTCKIYAYGLKGLDGEDVKRNEELPPIMWRNRVGESKIFVVNGKFFEENKGYGILTAILTQIYGDYLYPVANASVMIYDSIPYEGVANEELIKKLYSRDSLRFQTDILMPNLVSTCKRLDIVPTFYTSADSTMPEMDYFERSVLDLQGELIYLENASVKAIDISNPEGRIWNKYPDIPVIVTGFKKNDDDMTKLYSIGSTFGVVVHKVDVSKIINPESEDVNWVKVSKDYSEYIAYYQEDFGAFESMTAQEASIRYMEYRLMEPHISYRENDIEVEIEHMPEKVSFLLRTEKEIEEASGCEYMKLCDGAYLIETEQNHISISLKGENAVFQGDF